MKLKLNIQMFAEETGDGVTEETPVAEDTQKELSFQDIVKDPKYQADLDKYVGKALSSARTNWEADYNKKLEAERNEAEKLAKMDAEQKIKYELDKERQKREELENKLNAETLYRTASSIASEKDLPIGYLDLFDFSKETAESVDEKLKKIEELRSRDRESYLKSKFTEQAPKEKKSNVKYDPYIEGFMSE